VLKELRLAAILLDFSKTDVRHINEDFLKAGLEQQLPMGGAAAAQPQSVSIPGLGLEVPAASSAVAEARAMNDEILRTAAVVRNGTADLGDERKTVAQDTWDNTKKAFDDAIEAAGRSARLRKRKQLAPARLAEACASIDQCVNDLVQARTSRSLDEEAFDDAVVQLRGSLLKLAQQAGRGVPQPGDGVAWLLEAVAAEGSR
ncbi:transcriptional regulator, partial [Nocardia asteroides]